MSREATAVTVFIDLRNVVHVETDVPGSEWT